MYLYPISIVNQLVCIHDTNYDIDPSIGFYSHSSFKFDVFCLAIKCAQIQLGIRCVQKSRESFSYGFHLDDIKQFPLKCLTIETWLCLLLWWWWWWWCLALYFFEFWESALASILYKTNYYQGVGRESPSMESRLPRIHGNPCFPPPKNPLSLSLNPHLILLPTHLHILRILHYICGVSINKWYIKYANIRGLFLKAFFSNEIQLQKKSLTSFLPVRYSRDVKFVI